MTDKTTPAEDDDHLIAHGVDEEPVEVNRRLFEGKSLMFITSFAALYAAFHMAALNGLSISEWTGIVIPFLPTFPMETWNFRIVHVAGALALGFLLFAGRIDFPEKGQETPILGYAAYALMIPALFSLGMAFSFAAEISNGKMWNGIDEGIKFSETYLFGLPLIALRGVSDGRAELKALEDWTSTLHHVDENLAAALDRLRKAGLRPTRQRLALARLIAAPRSLWLLDEPLSPLDARWRQAAGELMQAHLDRGGIILAAVHDPLPVAARAVEIGSGR